MQKFVNLLKIIIKKAGLKLKNIQTKLENAKKAAAEARMARGDKRGKDK